MLLSSQWYVKNNILEKKSLLLKELRARQFYRPKRKPLFSTDVICYVLHLRYTSLRAYKLLLKKLSLPSVSNPKSCYDAMKALFLVSKFKVIQLRLYQHRKMRGEQFLVGLRDYIKSERILSCRTLIAVHVNF